jgi:periplasmic copper chaperone A
MTSSFQKIPKYIATYVLLTLTLGVFSSIHAQSPAPNAAAAALKVEGAWVRTAVPGQSGTGGFMTLTAKQDMKLVGITVSPSVAGIGEVHEMTMVGDVMKMRAIPSIALPAGKAVQLKPGGLHLMLMDLKKGLPKDSTVEVTLLLEDAKGAKSKQTLQLPVRATPPAGAAADPHAGHAGMKH